MTLDSQKNSQIVRNMGDIEVRKKNHKMCKKWVCDKKDCLKKYLISYIWILTILDVNTCVYKYTYLCASVVKFFKYKCPPPVN